MIGVLGATGNVGSALVKELVAAGERVVAISAGGGEGGPTVKYAKADLLRPESLVEPLTGARAVFVLAPVETHHRFDAAAVLRSVKAAGAERVVVLSSMGVASRPDARGYDGLRALEDAARKSGLGVTILRPTGFASNAFAWTESIRTTRTVVAPFGDVAIPIVDPADIAAVAALELRTKEHRAATYDLTGPAPTTPREQAAAIAAALGVPLQFVEATRDQAATAMRAFFPEDLVEATLDISGMPTANEQRVSLDVERLLGRPASPFAAWAQRNVDAFR